NFDPGVLKTVLTVTGIQHRKSDLLYVDVAKPAASAGPSFQQVSSIFNNPNASFIRSSLTTKTASGR
ncbi:hypothetical protein O5254_27375, partial [Escherichia coli]|nr:hypothetical protein [Escherichia coli]